MKKHIKEIDILKGFAIFLVLLGHSIIVYPIDLNTKYVWCGIIHNSFVHPVHLPLFFTVSGFCYSFRGWRDFLSKKTKRILIPLAVFFIASIFIGLIFGQSGLLNGTRNVTWKSTLNSLLYGTSVDFLYTMMLIFLIFPFIEKILKYTPGKIIAITLMLVAQCFDFWPTEFTIHKIVYYLPFFTMGYFLRQMYNGGKLSFSDVSFARKLFICLIAFTEWVVLAVLKTYYVNGSSYVIEKWYGILITLVGIICLVFLANLISKKMVSRPFESFGKYSLQLYLLNGYFLTITRAVVCNVLHITNPFAIIGLNLIGILGVNYLVVRFILARVKFFRVLTGIPESLAEKY